LLIETNVTRILIADDHELVRRGICHTLENEPTEFEVVGEAANGFEAVELARNLTPDLVILDINMPGMSGLQALREITGVDRHPRVLVLSVDDSEAVILEALAAGAQGYLLKTDAARDLITAIHSLLAGRPFFTAKVAQTLLARYVRGGLSGRREPRSRLTPREQEIVRLVADGKTNKEMAALLNISIRTVETHRSNVMEKLDVHSVSDLVLYAIQHGLKDPTTPGGQSTR
jgi:DNA-binding NarL/FixJ family response regulator